MYAQQLLKQISPKMEEEDFSDATAEYNLIKNRYASKIAGTNGHVCLRKKWFNKIYSNANSLVDYNNAPGRAHSWPRLHLQQS